MDAKFDCRATKRKYFKHVKDNGYGTGGEWRFQFLDQEEEHL